MCVGGGGSHLNQYNSRSKYHITRRHPAGFLYFSSRRALFFFFSPQGVFAVIERDLSWIGLISCCVTGQRCSVSVSPECLQGPRLSKGHLCFVSILERERHCCFGSCLWKQNMQSRLVARRVLWCLLFFGRSFAVGEGKELLCYCTAVYFFYQRLCCEFFLVLKYFPLK